MNHAKKIEIKTPRGWRTVTIKGHKLLRKNYVENER